jgi:hypothetical protein
LANSSLDMVQTTTSQLVLKLFWDSEKLTSSYFTRCMEKKVCWGVIWRIETMVDRLDTFAAIWNPGMRRWCGLERLSF